MIYDLLADVRKLHRISHPYRLQSEIQLLERKARTAPGETRAQLYNRLGDLSIRAGDRHGALVNFGHAIDAHLMTGRYDAAKTLCRKVITLAPEVVRARCTLAFLVAGEDGAVSAEQLIGDYVRAARRAGRSSLAVTRLRLLANVTGDQDVRLVLARQLAELGDIHGSNEVFSAVYAERRGLHRAANLNQRERWAQVLRLALTGPLLENEKTEPEPVSARQ